VRDEFYVGYLPTPASHARFLRRIIPALFALIVLVTGVIALTQRDPGPGVWMIGPVLPYEGVLRAKPYPMLELTTSDGPRHAFLVEVGKHGAGARAAEFDGQRVRVQGWPLERDGRRIIELAPDDSAIQPVPDVAIDSPAPMEEQLGRARLRGEIVDFKCFLGAMKPGDGKGHKACATLCIRGGIPPMLVTSDEVGNRTYYLLRDAGGGPCGEEILPVVGELVDVEGALSRVADLMVLSVRASDVLRVR
jgi:hypothetical protein